MNLMQPEYEALLQLRGYQPDRFSFDDAYLDRLLRCLGKRRDEIDLEAFAQDHFNLLFVFLQARDLEARRPSITEENRALSLAQNAAWRLWEALADLRKVGEADHRLREEMAQLKHPQFALMGAKLADFFQGPPHDANGDFNRLLFDLQVALERAKIVKPRAARKAVHESPILTSAAANSDWVKYAARDDDPEGRYLTRKAQHGLERESALVNLVLEVGRFWPKHSDRPFTEGRNHGGRIQNVSEPVEFIMICLEAFGAKYPRSLVAKKVRHVREALKSGQ